MCRPLDDSNITYHFSIGWVLLACSGHNESLYTTFLLPRFIVIYVVFNTEN